ncbi:MAG: hypothetical protein CVU64_15375 [Deltaproteobacteria bacterium HGW-Deltaproteobacteria-21]|nr:MAG: hypothetical protein CVU64_15375 [Deltaproteobacteria bacterium HGW-Deltaproteobacteria-21]
MRFISDAPQGVRGVQHSIKKDLTLFSDVWYAEFFEFPRIFFTLVGRPGTGRRTSLLPRAIPLRKMKGGVRLESLRKHGEKLLNMRPGGDRSENKSFLAGKCIRKTSLKGK